MKDNIFLLRIVPFPVKTIWQFRKHTCNAKS